MPQHPPTRKRIFGVFPVHRRVGHFLLVITSFLTITTTSGRSSVCVRVKIEIEQTVTLERQAFRATMKVNNGGEADLTGFQVAVNFADEQGNAVAVTTNPNANQEDVAFFYRLVSPSSLPNQ